MIMSLTDCGVKAVEVRVKDENVTINVWDGECKDGDPEVFNLTLTKDMDKHVLTQVEEFFLTMEMGPTWFWSFDHAGSKWTNGRIWDGQFAHFKNWKYSDRFAWKTFSL